MPATLRKTGKHGVTRTRSVRGWESEQLVTVGKGFPTWSIQFVKAAKAANFFSISPSPFLTNLGIFLLERHNIGSAKFSHTILHGALRLIGGTVNP